MMPAEEAKRCYLKLFSELPTRVVLGNWASGIMGFSETQRDVRTYEEGPGS
jgi:hypothetical protein